MQLRGGGSLGTLDQPSELRESAPVEKLYAGESDLSLCDDVVHSVSQYSEVRGTAPPKQRGSVSFHSCAVECGDGESRKKSRGVVVIWRRRTGGRSMSRANTACWRAGFVTDIIPR